LYSIRIAEFPADNTGKAMLLNQSDNDNIGKAVWQWQYW
jgi:hypothetical protein